MPAAPSPWILIHRTKRTAKSSRDFHAYYAYIASNWKKMGRAQLYDLAVEAAECLTPAGSPVCKFVAQGITMSLDAKHDGKNTKDPWTTKKPATRPGPSAPSARQQVTPPPEDASSPSPAPDLDTNVQDSPIQSAQQLPTPDPTPAKPTAPNPDEAVGVAVVQYIRRTRSEMKQRTDAIQNLIQEQEAELYKTPAQDAEKRKEVEGSVRELRSFRQQLLDLEVEEEA